MFLFNRDILPIHPSFRIVALAEPPVVGSSKQQWMSPEMLTMFLYHQLRPLSRREEFNVISSMVGEALYCLLVLAIRSEKGTKWRLCRHRNMNTVGLLVLAIRSEKGTKWRLCRHRNMNTVGLLVLAIRSEKGTKWRLCRHGNMNTVGLLVLAIRSEKGNKWRLCRHGNMNTVEWSILKTSFMQTSSQTCLLIEWYYAFILFVSFIFLSASCVNKFCLNPLWCKYLWFWFLQIHENVMLFCLTELLWPKIRFQCFCCGLLLYYNPES